MKIVRKIGKILGIIGLILMLLLAVTAVYHRVSISKNKEFMKEQGFYNPVSTGEHSLNLVKYGSAEDGHRIIALGGNGAGFPVELRELAEELQEDNQVYYLARPGYDGSDDVRQDMTVGFVVEDYRKALRNAGISAPYVLLPHSYAGILASYWVNKYPDEIEGMIILDGVVAQPFTEEQLQEAKEGLSGVDSARFMVNLGIMDVGQRMFFPEDPDYSEEEQRMYTAMHLMTMGTAAFGSEIRCAIDNTYETWNVLQPNDVPKIYISAENGYQSAEELKAADVLSEYRINYLTEGFEGSDEERQNKAYELEWEEMQNYKKEKIQPYVEKLGSCKIVNLPGSHFIHEEKPEECAEIIKEFLNGLN